MDQTIQALKQNEIAVFERGHEEYERSVATPNLLYRFARPYVVLQPKTPEHVQEIIKHARAHKLLVTIKCGGHSYAGHSTSFEGGVSLDLRKMNETKLDMASKTITFGAGCQWGHVYKTLINGRHNGFVINGGRCPSVGVSGFLLGGGLGPFSRSIGMGCDTIQEITIVTADSKLVTVKRTDDPSSNEGRLFWALCGAGGGNFGVVVEMKLAVKKLRAPGGKVVAGRYQWFASKDEPDLFAQDNFLSTMNDFYTTDWPEHMTIDSTWICDLRQTTGNGVRFLPYFDGDKEDFDDTIDKYIKHPWLAKQLKRRSLDEKSTRFLHETLVAQWSEETVKAFPSNKSYSIYSSFVFRNDRPTIEKVTGLIRDKAFAFRQKFPGEKVEFLATFIHSGGKMSAPKPTDSAFFWREAVYHMYLTIEWEDKWMERAMRRFLKKAKDDLRPLSLQGTAAFINFPDGAMPGEVSEQAYWGNNSEELRRVKAIWDKDNFFRWRQGVRLPPKTPPKGQANSIQLEQSVRLASFSNEIPADNEEDFLEQLARGVHLPSSFAMEMPVESGQDVRFASGGPGAGFQNELKLGDEGDDEDLTDYLASKQWDEWDAYETAENTRDIKNLADMRF